MCRASRESQGAGAPEAAAGPRRAQLQAPEERREAVVGRDRQRAGEPAADEHRVDESAGRGRRRRAAARRRRGARRRRRAAPSRPSTQVVVEGRGARPEALHRRAGLDRLRRVDADVADVLAARRRSRLRSCRRRPPGRTRPRSPSPGPPRRVAARPTAAARAAATTSSSTRAADLTIPHAHLRARGAEDPGIAAPGA